MGDRFISWVYAIKSLVLGVDVNSVPQVAVTVAGGAQAKIYDITDNANYGKRAILIRIQNLGTEPIRWSEGMGHCDAVDYCGVIPAGNANDDGLGGYIEFRAHRPHDIYIHADNDYRYAAVLRYAYE